MRLADMHTIHGYRCLRELGDRGPRPETDVLESVAEQIAAQIAGEAARCPQPCITPCSLKAVAGGETPSVCLSALPVRQRNAGGVAARGNHAHGQFRFRFKDVEIPVTLAIAPAEPYQVTTLWFGPPVQRLKSWAELVARLTKLPGDVSFRGGTTRQLPADRRASARPRVGDRLGLQALCAGDARRPHTPVGAGGAAR